MLYKNFILFALYSGEKIFRKSFKILPSRHLISRCVIRDPVCEGARFLPCAGNPFLSSFETTVKKIHRLLMHVLAHVYQCHSRHLVHLRLHGHANTLTYHFMLFSKQFSLVDDKELDVLDDLYNRLRHHHSTVRRPTFGGEPAVPDDTMATAATATDSSSLAIDDLLQPTAPDAVLARILADDSNKENIVMTAAVSI